LNEQSSALEARPQSFNFCSIDFSTLARARQPVPAPPPFSGESSACQKGEGERKEKKERVGTSKDIEGVGDERTWPWSWGRGEGKQSADPRLLSLFPTDKVTALRNTSYFLPLTGRVLREKKANNSHCAVVSPFGYLH